MEAPNLDDRRFQDYVDEAKRLVQQRCPEWTDHNVSDPGVTLIETFAYMVDQLTYRLNLVPDRNYTKFLELIGVRRFAPSAAQAAVTFWLTSPQDRPVVVPRGTKVTTQRVDRREPLSFETIDDLVIATSALERVVCMGAAGSIIDRTARLGLEGFDAFGATPLPDDSLLIGLSEPSPGNVVALRFRCHIEGVGVDPEHPPLVWEAFDGVNWLGCEVERDETGGFNRPGDVVIHVPPEHTFALISGERAAWLRCKVIAPDPTQPFYSASPRIESVAAFVVGGTTNAVHAEVIDDEIIGIGEGIAGQRFSLLHRPVVLGAQPHVLDVAADDGWEEWIEVDTFAHSGLDDLHFVLDHVAGEIQLGPAVRLEDGTMANYGAVPQKGAPVRIRQYRAGGGGDGNVSAGAICAMRSSVPFIARVENRLAASGGVDAETIDNAKLRGPITLRTLGRAVTVEDYEQLALEAAPGIARVKCVPAGTMGQEGVRVLVVPAVADDEDGSIPFERLAPPPELLARVAEVLEQRRTIGARVVVEPPDYQGVTVVAQLRAYPLADPARVQYDAATELYRYLHPVYGGAEETGWPFSRPVNIGEIYALLQNVVGVELVETMQLYPADPVTGRRGTATERIEFAPNALVYSYHHEIRVLGR